MYAQMFGGMILIVSSAIPLMRGDTIMYGNGHVQKKRGMPRHFTYVITNAQNMTK